MKAKMATPITDAFNKYLKTATPKQLQKFCDDANALRCLPVLQKGRPTIYTSGSIEYAGDPFWWRKKVKSALGKQYDVIIPKTMKPKFAKTDPRYMKWVKDAFITHDMDRVRDCNHFLIQICKTTFKGMGTPSELSLAAWLGKPIVAWIDGVEIGTIPGWTLGCLDGAVLCSSIDEAIDHYRSIVS